MSWLARLFHRDPAPAEAERVASDSPAGAADPVDVRLESGPAEANAEPEEAGAAEPLLAAEGGDPDPAAGGGAAHLVRDSGGGAPPDPIVHGNREHIERTPGEMGATRSESESTAPDRLAAVLRERDPASLEAFLAAADASFGQHELGQALLAATSPLREVNLDIVRLLIGAGANVDYQEPEEYDLDRLGKPAGPTPLARAVDSGNLELVRILVAAGADPTLGDMGGCVSPLRSCSRSTDETDRAMTAEMHKARPRTLSADTLFDAAACGAVEIARQCLDAGVRVDCSTDLGSTPLKIAVLDGQPDIVELLIARGADLRGWGPDGGATAWLRAVERKLELARIYSAPKSDAAAMPDPVAAADPAGEPCAPTGEIEPPAPAAAPAPGSGDRLVAAAGAGDWPVVREVLAEEEHGPAVLAAALRRVAWRDSFRGTCEIAAALLEAGVEVDAPDPSDGNTALAFAVRSDNVELVRQLIGAGADPTLGYMKGRSAFDHCLRSQGKNMRAILAALQDAALVKPGDEALLAACEYGAPAIVRQALDAGAKSSARDPLGLDALSRAAKCGHSDLVGILLAHGADPNGETEIGTPLTAAIEGRNLTAVRLLVEAGADVNRPRPFDGFAPVALARAMGEAGIAAILVEAGAPAEERVEVLEPAPGQPPIRLDEGVNILKFPQGFENACRNHLRLVERLREAGVYPPLRVYALRATGEASVPRLILITGSREATASLPDIFYTREAEDFVSRECGGDWNAISPAASVTNVPSRDMPVDQDMFDRLALEAVSGAYVVEAEYG